MSISRSFTRCFTNPHLTNHPYPHFRDLTYSSPTRPYDVLDLIQSKASPKTLGYDAEAADYFNISQTVFNLLKFSDFFCLWTNTGRIYPTLTCEFLASFKPISQDGRTVAWTYTIGNCKFSRGREYICEIFHWAPEEPFIPFTPAEINQFWEKLTGLEEYTDFAPSSYIRSPAWRYIHLLVVDSINARDDLGTFVSPSDIEILLSISTRRNLNLFELLTDRIREWRMCESENLALGGCYFIERIARKEGFNLFRSHSQTRRLMIDELKALGIVDPTTGVWICTQAQGVNQSRPSSQRTTLKKRKRRTKWRKTTKRMSPR